jgi:hypothetical protein
VIPQKFGTTFHVLVVNHWLVIGIGQANVISMQARLIYHVFRSPAGALGKYTIVNLGDLTVLAVIAAQVAAKASDGQYGSARVEMIKGLFLYRIGGNGG